LGKFIFNVLLSKVEAVAVCMNLSTIHAPYTNKARAEHASTTREGPTSDTPLAS